MFILKIDYLFQYKYKSYLLVNEYKYDYDDEGFIAVSQITWLNRKIWSFSYCDEYL